MTVEFVEGNIWATEASYIVIPTNCRGVFGAGLAKQAAERAPEIVRFYRSWDNPQPGDVMYYTRHEGKGLIVANTKGDWRAPSRLEWIERILGQLAVRDQPGDSMALPPLGCGLGGLDWKEVLPLVKRYLGPLAGRYLVYGKDLAQEEPVVTAQQDVVFGDGSEAYKRLGNMAMKGVPPLEFDGTTFPTSEHMYQAYTRLFLRPELWGELNAIANTIEAKRFAQKHGQDTSSEDRLGAMRFVLDRKLEQDQGFRDLLLSTGTRRIVEASRHDRFWGVVGGEGDNQLGRLLMELRDEYLADHPEDPAVTQEELPMVTAPAKQQTLPTIDKIATTRVGTVTVVNRHTYQGAKEPLYVGRGTPFGNPYKTNKAGGTLEHGEATEAFRRHLGRLISARQRGGLLEALDTLGQRLRSGEDLVLACSCKPKACHADVIADYLANRFNVKVVSQKQPVCVITTRKGVSSYFSMDDAWADLARLYAVGYRFLGIVGSRRRDGEEMEETIDVAVDLLDQTYRMAVVSGGCTKGADRHAKRIGTTTPGAVYIEFPALWDNLEAPGAAIKTGKDGRRYNAAAGHQRNAYIARCCDRLVALPHESRQGGTESTIAAALKLGKEVELR